ncbi:MAG: septation protein A [Rhodospirillaceae bacterium]|nr:septation protein A [Rhodospirillaceae bacterium]
MAKPKPLNQWLKLALELGPLLIFFFANGRLGILNATIAFMVATALALAVSYALARTIPVMPLVGGVFVLIFGGLTVYLADETFIKLKPTIVNLMFAAILLAGLAMKRLFIKLVLESAIQLTDRGWLILTRAWIGFFVFLAAVNEIVWRNFSTDTWVSFKVFGIMPITLVFSFALIPVMMRHSLEPKSADRAEPDKP